MCRTSGCTSRGTPMSTERKERCWRDFIAVRTVRDRRLVTGAPAGAGRARDQALAQDFERPGAQAGIETILHLLQDLGLAEHERLESRSHPIQLFLRTTAVIFVAMLRIPVG